MRGGEYLQQLVLDLVKEETSNQDKHRLKFTGSIDDQGICVYLFQCQHCWVNWRVERGWFWGIA